MAHPDDRLPEKPRCPCTWGECPKGGVHECDLEKSHTTMNCLCGKCGTAG